MSYMNPGRAHVAQALSNVIEHQLGKPGVCEMDILNNWIEEISLNQSLTVNGWYDPPKRGAVILTCRDDDTRRSHFTSFRDPVSFTSDRAIDWTRDVLIAYASNVDFTTGLPADFATTVYFGNNRSLIYYFQNCFSATKSCMDRIDVRWNSSDLFLCMERGLAERGISGKTWSSTDSDYNYGHTLPPLVRETDGAPLVSHRDLQSDHAHRMRLARRFVSASSSWLLDCGEQFTIEPQCTSLNIPSLPKVMIHYAAAIEGDEILVCRSCDDLPRSLGLL